jgi:hypothetical protein
MIGQGIGLKYLVPVALVPLDNDPLAAGDFYRGDLLKNVLGVSEGFWSANPELLKKRDEIAKWQEMRSMVSTLKNSTQS